MQINHNNTYSLHNRIHAILFLVLISGTIIFLDKLSKYFVLQTLPNMYDQWQPFSGAGRLFRFIHITNSGAAFGMFDQHSNFFLVIAIVVSIVMIFYYLTLPIDNWITRFSFGLILGGAIGNLSDRIQHDGHVIDFIDIGFWPIFNIADISIVTGVTILGIWILQFEEGQKTI